MAKYGDKAKDKISRPEQETLIIFNNEDEAAKVYSWDSALIRKM